MLLNGLMEVRYALRLLSARMRSEKIKGLEFYIGPDMNPHRLHIAWEEGSNAVRDLYIFKSELKKSVSSNIATHEYHLYFEGTFGSSNIITITGSHQEKTHHNGKFGGDGNYRIDISESADTSTRLAFSEIVKKIEENRVKSSPSLKDVYLQNNGKIPSWRDWAQLTPEERTKQAKHFKRLDDKLAELKGLSP